MKQKMYIFSFLNKTSSTFLQICKQDISFFHLSASFFKPPYCPICLFQFQSYNHPLHNKVFENAFFCPFNVESL